MGEADVTVSVSRVLAVLRGAGRAEGTVRRQQVVLERFAGFLAGRGLDTVSDRVCIDFIANQTGVRLASLREPVENRAVQAVRRPVVLMAEVLAGRAIDVDRTVVPAKDGCPAKFRPPVEVAQFEPAQIRDPQPEPRGRQDHRVVAFAGGGLTVDHGQHPANLIRGPQVRLGLVTDVPVRWQPIRQTARCPSGGGQEVQEVGQA